MVISALRVEIPTTVGAETPSQPDELEIAAAVAAVLSYIDLSDNKNYLINDASIDDTTKQAWQKASYQEAAGGARSVAPRGYCKLSAWQSAGFFKVCLSLPLLCLSLYLSTRSASAQDAPVLRELPTNMYSRITPAQGYPFVNGRSTGAGSQTRAQNSVTAPAQTSSDVQSNRVFIPFNGPVAAQAAKDDSTGDEDRLERHETSVIQPPVIVQPSRVIQTKWALPQSQASSQRDYSNIGTEAQTIKTKTSIKPEPAAADPTIQALVQAANQLNPDFAGRKTLIKVGLAFANTRTDLAAIDGAQVRDAASGSLVASLPPSSKWDVVLQNNGRAAQLAFVARRASDNQSSPSGGSDNTGIAYGESGKYKEVAYFPGARAATNYAPSHIRLPFRLANDNSGIVDPSQISSSGYIVSPKSGDPNSVIVVGGKLYRGAIWLKPLPRLVAGGLYRAAAFDVINLVDLEDYLLSVVPSEMPSGWPLEALKAQAIAARSYAVANIGKHGKDGYDLKATIDDQVYSGVSTESDNSNLAVAETSGLVLKHEGKAITAFFHSTSGGSTEFAENVWSKPLPYLRSVPDYDDASPHFSWTKKISVDDLEKNVATDIGRLLSLSVVSRTGSNRAQYILVQGVNGSKLVTGETLRKMYKLPSTLFNVGSETNAYIFAGRGYGHGLGMSQYGAKALAERGCNAAQILSYYYKDVTVDDATAAPSI